MKIYPNITAYLEDKSLSLSNCSLSAKDRPFLILEKYEYFWEVPNDLIKITDKIYEVCFPLISLADWENTKTLVSQVGVKFNQGDQTFLISLNINDEVLDATQINDEKTQKYLQLELEKKYDRLTADTIAIFLGVFYGMRSQTRKSVKFPLLQLPQCLKELSREEARLPLVVALDRRYQLRRNLEIITPKLRSQLNRVAEMMSLGRIQEMDAYCLRDYVRRPGRDSIEKAGARQELLGIQRFQNYNTPENKFLKGFCELLHLECQQYNYQETKLLKTSIDYFLQDPTVQSIQKTASLLDKPNYVLEQNAIYRSFYQAYLDFIHRRTDKEKLWGLRRQLATDIVGVLLMATLLRFQGSYTSSLASLSILDIANNGYYIEDNSLPIIQLFFNDRIVSFQLKRSMDINKGDWTLDVKQQKYNSLNYIEKELYIWVFWYCPTKEITARLQGHSLCFYFYHSYNQERLNPSVDLNKNLKLLRLPNPVIHNWQFSIAFLTKKIQKYMQEILL